MAESSSWPRPVADVSPAAWLQGAVAGTGSVVGVLLPRGFEVYARILHPADSPEGEPVRWSTAAEWAGRVIHPGVQFKALARNAGQTPRPWDEPPVRGELPPDQLKALCEVLSGQTTTPERCWFCLWEGWGWIQGGSAVAHFQATTGPEAPADPASAPSAFPEEVLEGPRVRLPWRDHLLFEGPLESALEMGDRGPGYFFPQSPNLFWPDDRAWCVATDIELDSTYVGGTAGLIKVLLDDPRLEVVRVDIDDPIGENSDQVNVSAP